MQYAFSVGVNSPPPPIHHHSRSSKKIYKYQTTLALLVVQLSQS